MSAAPSTSEPGERPLSYWSWGLVPFALAWLAAWAFGPVAIADGLLFVASAWLGGR